MLTHWRTQFSCLSGTMGMLPPNIPLALTQSFVVVAVSPSWYAFLCGSCFENLPDVPSLPFSNSDFVEWFGSSIAGALAVVHTFRGISISYGCFIKRTMIHSSHFHIHSVALQTDVVNITQQLITCETQLWPQLRATLHSLCQYLIISYANTISV